ncbi:DUF11 domain-containing protein [Alteromonas naphthalenivorans]|nr:DUF11 domain-containing protein [Alteromonas naphthalenivorans]
MESQIASSRLRASFLRLFWRLIFCSIMSVFASTSVHALEIETTLDNKIKREGGYLVYTVALINNDSVTRNDVTLTVSAPTGLEFKGYTALPNFTCNTCSGVVSYNVGTIVSGGSALFTIPLYPNSLFDDNYDSEMTISSSVTHGGSPTPVTNTALVTYVDEESILMKTTSANAFVEAGSDVTFEVTVGNIGDTGFAGSYISAAIPSGATFVSASDEGSLVGGEVVWQSASVLSGGSGEKRYFTVRLPNNASNGTVYKTQVKWARNSSLSAAQTSESMVVVRNSNNYLVETAVFGDTAMTGQASDYRFTVVNNSSQIQSNSTLYVKAGSYSRLYGSRIWPASAVPSTGVFYGDRWIALSVEELLPGESTSLLVPMSVYNPLDGMPIDLHAVLYSEDGIELQASHSVYLWDVEQSIRLGISSDKQKVEVGEFFEYELSFGNLTDTAYQNTVIELTLPEELEVIGASDSGVVSDTSVAWSVGTLSARSSGKRYLKVRAPETSDAGDIFKSTANIHNGGLSISRASEVVSVVDNRPLGLTIGQIGDIRSPSHYNYLRYVVTNTSNITRTDVALNISTSAGTRFAGNDGYPSAPSNGTYYGDNWASYSVGDLAPGEEYILTLPFSGYNQIDGAPQISDVILSDSVSAFIQGTKPSTLYSATNSVVFTVASDKQIVMPGDEVTLELNIANVSDSTIQNLAVPLTLPGQVTAQSATNDAEINGSNIKWSIGSLAVGTSVKRFITVTIDEDLSAGDSFKVAAGLESSSTTLARASEVLIVTETMPLVLTPTITGDTRSHAHYGYSKYVISNPGTTVRTDVVLAVSVDAGVRVYGNNTYPYYTNSSFYATDWMYYTFDVINPGESKVVQFPLNSYRQIDGKPWVENAVLSDGLDSFIQSTRNTYSFDNERTISSHLSSDRSVVKVGESINFEVLYGNESNTNMQNLVLEVAIPEGLNVETINDGGSFADGVVQWELGTLTSGYAAKRSFTASVSNTLNDADAVVVKSNILQSGESLTRSNESIVVKADTSLTLDVTYEQGITSFIISNTDDVSHADVELVIQPGNYSRYYTPDALPLNGSSTKYANERVVYEFGELSAGETRAVVVPFYSYQAKAGGISVAHATLESSTTDYVLTATPTLAYTSELGGALPQLAIDSTSHHMSAGEEISLKVTVGNPSQQIIESAMLQVPVPSNAEFVSASGVYEVVDDIVYWPLGNIPVGNWHQLSITLAADSNLEPGDTIHTNARIVANSTTRTLAVASQVNVIQERPLSITATQTVGYPLQQGAQMQISIGVENNKLTELADVELYFMPPQGTRVYSSDIVGGGCTNGSYCTFRDWVLWDLGNMAGSKISNVSVAPLLLTGSYGVSNGSVLTSTYFAEHTSNNLSTTLLQTSYGVGNAYEIDTNHDSDGDGIPDFWELRYSHLANWLDSSDAGDDLDGDGYTNLQEYLNGLSPDNRDPKDTDFDSLLDSVEIALGLDPLSEDSDGDGLIDRLDNWPSIYNEAQSGLTDLLSVGDVTGDGSDDFALISVVDGIVSASVVNGANDTISHNINWSTEYQDVQAYILEDINGNGSVEIGIFGMISANDASGNAVIKPQLFVKDGKTGNRINVYNWSANWLETSLVVLDDVTGDGIADFGMQGRFIVEGARPQLFVKDAVSGSNVTTYGYPSLFKNPKFYQLSDFNGDGVDDVGLFGEIERNGKVQIKITDGTDSGNKLKAYNFAANWNNVSWHRLSDINGDSVDDWGMFGTRKDDNKPQLFTKSGVSTSGTLGIYTWPEDLESTSFHIIPDFTSDGVDELAVGGFRTSAGRYQLTVRDGTSRSTTLVNYGWPSNWTEVSFDVVGDLTNDGVNEVMLFGLRSNGNYELSIKDGIASNGAYATVNLGNDWLAKPSFKLIGDIDYDGTPTVVVYGKSKAGVDKYQLLD